MWQTPPCKSNYLEFKDGKLNQPLPIHSSGEISAFFFLNEDHKNKVATDVDINHYMPSLGEMLEVLHLSSLP